MTLVVTHAEGFLGCFTTEPDGSLRQRALIDTGSDAPTPQELAELGTTLADHWGWALNGHAPAPPPVKKVQPQKQALPAQKPKPLKNKPGYVYRQYPPMVEREAMLLEHFREHPGSTLKQALESLEQPTDKSAVSNWSHSARALTQQGKLRKVGAGQGSNPHRYFLMNADS